MFFTLRGGIIKVRTGREALSAKEKTMYVLGEGKPAARRANMEQEVANMEQEVKNAKDELTALAEGGNVWQMLLGGKEEKHNV